jgi:predicted amidohydrolase
MADDAVRLRIALAQVNPTVGDIEGNASLISAWIAKAREAGAQLVVFPSRRSRATRPRTCG